jgi:hypothetical protein
MGREAPEKGQAELLDNLKRLLASAESFAEISGSLDRGGTSLVLRFNSDTGQGPIKGDTTLARNVAELIASHSI